MTKDLEYDGLSLLARADKRYRLTAYVLMGFLFICAFLFAVILFITLMKQQEQAAYLSKQINDITKQRLLETQRQNEHTRRYITCLFVLPIAQRTIEAQKECYEKSRSGLSNFDPTASLDRTSGPEASAHDLLLVGMENVSSHDDISSLLLGTVANNSLRGSAWH